MKRLLDLKEICSEYLPSSLQLKMGEWMEIEEVLKVLAPVNILTLKLQQSNLFLPKKINMYIKTIIRKCSQN